MHRAVLQPQHVRVSVHVQKGMEAHLIRDLELGNGGILYTVGSASSVSEISLDLSARNITNPATRRLISPLEICVILSEWEYGAVVKHNAQQKELLFYCLCSFKCFHL